jgi:hypothetical protein
MEFDQCGQSFDQCGQMAYSKSGRDRNERVAHSVALRKMLADVLASLVLQQPKYLFDSF